MFIVEAIHRVVEGRNLDRSEAESVMNEIMAGTTSDAQIAAFLTALRMKRETIDELVGFAQAVRSRVCRVLPSLAVGTPFSVAGSEILVDTCGTGGDAGGTFNISTAAAFVATRAARPQRSVDRRADTFGS